MKSKTYFKVAMFNFSLLPLYLILFIQHFDISSVYVPNTLNQVKNIVKQLLISNSLILSLTFLLFAFGLLALYLFNKSLKYDREDSQEVKNVKSKDFEHLTFIATYVLPLFAYRINGAQSFIVFLLLLILIGTLYVKLNWYYLNPVLLLFGYFIYSAEVDNKNVTLIAKFRIDKNNLKSRYIDLGDSIWYLIDDE